MKLLNINRAGQDFYASFEGCCADCGEPLEVNSPAYAYIRRGEPVFKCCPCVDEPIEDLEKSFEDHLYSI